MEDGEDDFPFTLDESNSPPPFHQDNYIPLNMSRPTTSMGIPSSRIEDNSNRIQDRRTTLDPSMMTAMRHARPETPVTGIPHSMVRRTKHKYDTGAKIIEAIKRSIELKTGCYITDEEVSQIMDTLLSTDPMTRCFTQLTSKDMPFLYEGFAGMVVHDKDLFTAKPPDFFYQQLKVLSLSATREKEAGARLFIGHYLSHAVKEARRVYGLDRLVFYSEAEIEAQEVGQLGWLSGITDFAVAKVKGEGKIDGEMLGEDGGLYCKPEDPVLVVVEAKRTATLNITASEAEVLGQIRTLMQKRGNAAAMTGVLTDCYSWRIFHITENLVMYKSTFRADSKESILQILSILTLLCGGQCPKPRGQSSIYLDNALYLQDHNQNIYDDF